MKRFFRLSVVLSGMLLLSACNNAPADPEGDKNATNPNEGNDTTGDVAYFYKKTGQTKSYNGDGNEVTDGSVKDDGYYQTGVALSYTRNNEKEIVTDNVTGLQWQDDTNVSSVTKPWLSQENYDKCKGLSGQTQDTSKCADTSGDTAATYCENLGLGGYTDWRLPTLDELMYITDRTKRSLEPPAPAIDTTIFQNLDTDFGYYWSSMSQVDHDDFACGVDFNNGDNFCGYKHYSRHRYVRCVRSESNSE